MNTPQIAITVDDVEFFHIPNHEGYAVSRCGKIRSLDRIVTSRKNIRRSFPGTELSPDVGRNGYLRVRLANRKAFLVHRLVGFTFMGLTSSQDIDHINRVRNDCRLENLRISSRSENGHNRKAKGYSLCRDRGKFRAFITINRKKRFLGRFPTEEEARSAYLSAKKDSGMIHPTVYV